ncbi:MAG TPA: hypothetical protein VGM39_19225 [Kofleriaceae bacterium]|jgi:hypothetical protein
MRLTNMVTGGSATVTASIDGVPFLGLPSKVHVQAVVHDDMKSNGSYVEVRATLTRTHMQRGVEADETSIEYENKIYVSGAEPLVAGQTYEWSGQVTLPIEEHRTGEGRTSYMRCRWELRAGLDVLGNDPDSGWQSFDVTNK